MDPRPAVSSLIHFSWQKTKEILFPFQLKRWLKILVIVWLSGHAAGLGSNLNIPRRQKPAQVPTQAEQVVQPKAQTRQAPAGPGSELSDDTAGAPQGTRTPTVAAPAGGQSRRPLSKTELMALVIAIPIVVMLVLFFMWLSSRFNFIFLDLLIHRDVRIGESFKTYKPLGNSYFLWSLGFGVVSIVAFLTLILIAALTASLTKALLWISIPIVVLLAIGFAVVGVLVADFAPPIMYHDGVRTMEACRKGLSFKPEVGQIILYVLLKMGLGILGGLAGLILTLIIGVLVLIIGLVTGLLGSLIVAAIPFLKPVFFTLGILGLIIGVVVVVVLAGLTTLPIAVFFGVFTLNYLTRFNPEYNLLSFPFSDFSPPKDQP